MRLEKVSMGQERGTKEMKWFRLLFPALVLALLCGCSADAVGQTDDVPIITSVTVFDSQETEISADDTGWIILPEDCIIRAEYDGFAEKAEFYAAPTGTETERALIGSVEIQDAEAPVSFEWDGTDEFMGYLSAVLYNRENVVTSEETFLVKAVSEQLA